MKDNIALIGMPGCGKSSIGVVPAKAPGYDFVDSDLLIQAREKRRLSEIIAEEGPERFNEIDEEVNASIEASHVAAEKCRFFCDHFWISACYSLLIRTVSLKDVRQAGRQIR